jgi:hypothetical protein
MKKRFRWLSVIRKISRLSVMIVVAIMGAMILSGCGIVPSLSIQAPFTGDEINDETNVPPLFVPESVRNTALIFIKVNYDLATLPPIQDWDAGEFISSEFDEPMTYQYRAIDWVARISFPSSTPGRA